MLAFDVASVAVSGANVTVVTTNLNGQGPVRLFVKNSGAAALTAGKVQLGPTASGPWEDLDTATFQTLGSGVTKSLVIAKPVAGLKFIASCGTSTTVDVSCVEGLQD